MHFVLVKFLILTPRRWNEKNFTVDVTVCRIMEQSQLISQLLELIKYLKAAFISNKFLSQATASLSYLLYFLLQNTWNVFKFKIKLKTFTNFQGNMRTDLQSW